MENSIKIGITSIIPKNFFQSGCFQQSLVTYKLFCNAGYDCYLLVGNNVDEEGLKVTNRLGFKIITMTENLEELNGFGLIIHISGYFSNQLQQPEKARKMGIKQVSMICGNYYYLCQEDVVFAKHNIIDSFMNKDVDEYWVLPMYKKYISFFKAVLNKPVICLDYSWDPIMIDDYLLQSNFISSYNSTYVEKLVQGPNNVASKTISYKQRVLLIFEPNLSIHKTCIVPLAIANSVFNKRPGLFDKIFVICKPDNPENLNKYVNHMSIGQHKMVEFLNKIPTFEVLHQLLKQNSVPIILSHQDNNELNFLHLELFYKNHLVVHNCEPFKECGYYYPENDIDIATDKLITALISGDPEDFDSKRNNKKLLNKYSIQNPNIILNYQTEIERIINN